MRLRSQGFLCFFSSPCLRDLFPVASDPCFSMILHHYLLISSQESIARSLVPTIISQGDRLSLAAGPFDALEMLQDSKPDAVLVAFDEDDHDAAVMCKTLRRQSNLPIVMLVNSTTRNQVTRGYRLGADAHIEIPCDPRVFHARVSAILRRLEQPEVPNETGSCLSAAPL